jgi:hypothetical protein
MALGEAAGTAAALAVQQRTSVQELRVPDLLREPVRHGAGPDRLLETLVAVGV